MFAVIGLSIITIISSSAYDIRCMKSNASQEPVSLILVDSLTRAYDVCENWYITGAKNMIRLHQWLTYLLTYRFKTNPPYNVILERRYKLRERFLFPVGCLFENMIHGLCIIIVPIRSDFVLPYGEV